jgi:CheY-like chemotaxis protein
MQASVPIQVEEVTEAGDSTATWNLLTRDGAFDVVLFDSRMPRSERQKVLTAVRDASGRPLAILVGPAELKSREVLTDGLEVDGALAKPIVAAELSELIESCIRARLPKRVLIVDDSATTRSIIRKVLRSSQFRIESQEASDGAAAIELANRQRFDVIFLDCNMPGLNGFTTLAQLKRAHPECKVVMISAIRDDRIENHARANGAVDFLRKPFFAKDFDELLKRAFGLMRQKWN